MSKNTEDGLTSTCRGINMRVWGVALSPQCEDRLGKKLLLNACACCIMLCPFQLRIVINSILKVMGSLLVQITSLPQLDLCMSAAYTYLYI